MVTKTQLMAGIVLIVLLLMIVHRLLPDEKKKIRRQFDRLSEAVEKEADEAPLATAMKGRAIAELLTNPCELTGLPSLEGQYSSREAAMIASGLRNYFTTLSLSFYDLSITLVDPQTATVTLTAQLSGQGRGGREAKEVREVDCTLHKVENTWLFNTCSVVEVMEK
ncbi:MAG: hypothetical protein EOM20_05500 [Spartobacteria bacterium]|nr:hypothetical protein [Spartobacteria bacterium]